MPSLGADMEAGTLLLWKVQPGDRVKRGDIIAEVATDKGDIEVEVFEDGVVEQILVEPGSKVPVGTALAVIRSDGEQVSVPAESAGPAAPQRALSEMGPPTELQPPPRTAADRRPRISPAARKLASDLGVDIDTVRGTGPGGAVQRADVERAAETKGALREVSERATDRTGMRRAIAAAMARSNREIPHYYLGTSIDLSATLSWLETENDKRPIQKRLLPAVLMVKAVAKALGDVPELNGYWSEDRHQPQESIHIGFAVSLREGGLIAPAIHHADRKSLDELMEAMRGLIERTRAGRLRSSEMTDATITVTNLGDLGVEAVYGVINPPQLALVGFGKITDRPWAENGAVGVRPVVTATLAADHRATDGRQGAQFLEALKRHLQEPASL